MLQSKAILAFDYPLVGWRSSRCMVQHGRRVRKAASCRAGHNAATASMSEAAALDDEAWSMAHGHGMMETIFWRAISLCLVRLRARSEIAAGLRGRVMASAGTRVFRC